MQTFRLFFFIFLFSLFYAEIAHAQWESASPSGIITIHSLEVSPDGSGGTYLFAGTGPAGGGQIPPGRVYRTSTHGQQWSSFTVGTNRNINSLMAVPNQSGGTDLFAALSFNPSVRLSTDHGETWSDANTGLPLKDYTSLAVIDEVIFAGTGSGTNKGVYKSTNYGSNWSQTALNNRGIFALATMDSHLLAGTLLFGFQFSSNNGTSWTEAGLTNENVYAIAVIDNNIFVSAKDSVFRTTDLGINWTPASNNLPTNKVLTFATYGNNLFASTKGFGVWLSTDFGGNWTNQSDGFETGFAARALIVNEPYLFAGRNGRGVWRRLLSQMVTSVELINNQIPNDFTLKQNYPNPFNPSTKIEYSIPSESFVELKVYDVLGSEVATLVNEQQQAGVYRADFTADNLPSGMYFARLTANKFTQVVKMILLK